MGSISREAAAIELIKRDRAKESLLDYAKYIDIPGKTSGDDEDSWVFDPVETGVARHHALLLTTMEKVVTGEIPRAMFFLPPGSAKSTYGSVVAPTWAMGRKPGTQIILTSYGSEIAKKHGRKARAICKSKKYKAVFGATVSKETGAADFWSTDNNSVYVDSQVVPQPNSEYMSGGILSGMTGNRADGLIIDDPVKGQQEADSETIQDRTWEAYQSDLSTRLKPGGWEFIILTRWQENDLAGKLLPEDYSGENGIIMCRDGREWFIVCIPAQCERADDPIGRKIGEYLWPEWFPEDHWGRFKLRARVWSALFQQRPQPPEGTFFQRDWFKRYAIGTQPRNLNHYATSDHAPGGEDHNDFNCFRIWGISSDNHVWMRAGFRKQETLDKFTDEALPLIKTFKPHCWFPENDNNWKSIEGFVEREMLKERKYCRIEPISPHGQDKQTKAKSFQAMAAMGLVHIPEGPEGDAIIDQYIRFPTGKNDDEVDAAAIIGRVIDEAHPALAATPKEEPKTKAQEDFDRILGRSNSRATNIDEYSSIGAGGI